LVGWKARVADRRRRASRHGGRLRDLFHRGGPPACGRPRGFFVSSSAVIRNRNRTIPSAVSDPRGIAALNAGPSQRRTAALSVRFWLAINRAWLGGAGFTTSSLAARRRGYVGHRSRLPWSPTPRVTCSLGVGTHRDQRWRYVARVPGGPGCAPLGGRRAAGAWVRRSAALIGAAAAVGFAGMVLDSALCASMQGRFRCPASAQPSERRRTSVRTPTRPGWEDLLARQRRLETHWRQVAAGWRLVRVVWLARPSLLSNWVRTTPIEPGPTAGVYLQACRCPPAGGESPATASLEAPQPIRPDRPWHGVVIGFFRVRPDRHVRIRP
jgi:hypothetical protein